MSDEKQQSAYPVAQPTQQAVYPGYPPQQGAYPGAAPVVQYQQQGTVQYQQQSAPTQFMGYPQQAGPTVVTVQQPQAPQVVVVQQPQGANRAQIDSDKYHVGLCNCCHNPLNCVLAFIGCYCILMCKAANRLDENCCYPFCFGVIPLNVRFRSIVGIKEDMCTEGCTFCFCPCCFGLRMVNEMDARDFHMHRS